MVSFVQKLCSEIGPAETGFINVHTLFNRVRILSW